MVLSLANDQKVIALSKKFACLMFCTVNEDFSTRIIGDCSDSSGNESTGLINNVLAACHFPYVRPPPHYPLNRQTSLLNNFWTRYYAKSWKSSMEIEKRNFTNHSFRKKTLPISQLHFEVDMKVSNYKQNKRLDHLKHSTLTSCISKQGSNLS